MAGDAGFSLAEAYALRAMHKEKMKKLEKQEAVHSDQSTGVVADEEKKIPSGCFFWVFKKSHSAKVSSAAGELM